jgi:hypothetical protein
VWENEPSHSQVSSHFGELESRWTFESSGSDCRGQNPLDWKVLYIIGKLLKHRCLKWVHKTHLDTKNISYGQKKGHESNWQFDFRPLKVENQLNLLAFKWCATYHWKALNERYNFAWDLISIRGLNTKLWGPKFTGVPTLGILRLSFGSPKTKCHLNAGFVERHIIYYKGEGGGFPQVWAVVSLVGSNLPMVCSNTKSAPIMH